ncbi:MAG: ABC transporter substrate-binding protein [Thermoleophilia bacterium]
MRSSFSRCLAIVALGLVFIGSGCSSQGATTTSLDTGEVSGFPTTTPGSSSPGEAVLAVAAAPFEDLDPAAASTTGDILLLHQIYDWLVEVDGDGSLRPGLALRWEESGSTGWAFTLRPNVVFHDGDTFDSKDVVFTFQRLRDLALAASPGHEPAAPFAAIRSVTALTPERVLFVLAEHDPEFPATVSEDAAALLSAGTSNPSREWVGTGPFVLWSYIPQSGAVLKRSSGYWARDAGGRLLPYLDGVDIVFEPDVDAALADLESGRMGFVGGLSADEARLAAVFAGVDVVEAGSNEHLAILMQSEPGSPLEDVRVRRALKLATDRPALAAAVRAGFAVPGNDSPIGPFYGELHLEWSPAVDAEAAIALLAEAGFPQGFALDLTVGDDAEALELAAVWKAQMEAIGVGVTVVTPGTAGTTGTSSTTPADEGPAAPAARAEVTRSLTAASPWIYLTGTYRVGSAAGDVVRWDDEEFGALLEELGAAPDEADRVDVYHRAQEILRDRGPAIVPFFESALVGVDERVQGLAPAPYWPRTSFRAVSLGT